LLVIFYLRPKLDEKNKVVIEKNLIKTDFFGKKKQLRKNIKNIIDIMNFIQKEFNFQDNFNIFEKDGSDLNFENLKEEYVIIKKEEMQ
jgi:hypothetical protein